MPVVEATQLVVRGLLGIALSLCSSLLVLAQPPATPTPADGYRFQTATIPDDPRHIGGQAYRVLAPAGWRVEGIVTWRNAADDAAAPFVKLIGPARQEIGVLPPVSFVWNAQMLANRVRPGSFVSGIEVQPPYLDPVQCIKTILIPRYLHNLASADTVKQQPLPELAEAGHLKYPQPAYKSAVFQAGKMRFEYIENGIPMEEDVYVLIIAVQVQSGSTVSTVWAPDEIRYSKAPKGTLDAQLPLFQTVLSSLRPNFAWWARLQQVSHELARLQAQTGTSAAGRAMQQQAAAADRAYTNRELSKNDPPVSDAIKNAYQARQSVMDQINARWDGAARQLDVYRNPATGDTVALPSGLNAAWSSQNGEFLVTGSATYDPNAGSGGAWTRLERVKP